jgi:hypothetical protein
MRGRSWGRATVWLAASLAGVAIVVLGPSPAIGAGPVRAHVAVAAGQSLGPTNPALRGMVWNTGPIDGVIPLQPAGIRIDASLQNASTGPGQLDLSSLLGKISEVRRAGAEPLVILSYMPRWLANTAPGDPRDPTRVAPRDLDTWQQLIEQVVQGVAAVPGGARRFEVWNEPNLPVFWEDSQAAFIQMAIRTHAAVAAVKARTGLPLEVGGPATVFPDVSWIVPYKTATTAAGLPPAFITWHWYFTIGQDGNEGMIPDAAYNAIRGHDNPFNSPAAFGPQIALMRGLLGNDTKLMIDEWNVAAGGYDHRHDTQSGAAYQAGALTEMERAGLDAAFLYRAVDDPSDRGRIGDWGLVDSSGQPKPAWWVFDAFHRTDGTRVQTSGDDSLHGFWARATRGPGRVDLILSSFSLTQPTPRTVDVNVSGFRAACATVQTIDTPNGSFAGGPETSVTGHITVRVPSPSVVWVHLTDSCETGGA